MFKHSIVKSKTTSLVLRVLMYLFLIALILFILHLYIEGGWREIIDFYKYFLNAKRIEAFVSSFGPFAAVVFVVLQALQVVFAPIPGELTGVVGGVLFGNIKGTIFSTIGLTVGSVLAFEIARLFGLRFVEKVVKKEYISKFNDFVTHKGLYISYILFLIPGFPKDSLCYLLGLTRMKRLDFFLMTFLGRLPGTVILTFQGTALKDARYKSFVILLLASAAGTLILYCARNHMIRSFGNVMHRLHGKKGNKRRKADPVVRKKVK